MKTMEITPIKNIAQYDSYRAEARRLVGLDPDPESVEGKKLSLLALVIEGYEKEKFAFDKPSPLEAILFRMEQQGLNQSDLVEYLGSRSRVSEILAGKRPLTLTMIRNLSEGLGIPAGILIQDYSQESSGDEEDESSEVLDWKLFPIKEMVKREWLPPISGASKNYPIEKVKEFFVPMGGPSEVRALWRKSDNSKEKSTSYALTAWAGQVLRRAAKVISPVDFRDGVINDDFKTTLTHLSILDNGPLAAQEFLLKRGIILIIETHLPGTRLDGAALLLNGKTPVIGLTLRYDRLDNFWFTLMHEVIHVERHLFKGQLVFFDDLDQRATSDVEREADRESRELLVARSKLKRSKAFNARTEIEVKKFAEELGVHPAIVAGRIRYELNDFQIFSSLLESNQVRKLFAVIN